MKAFKLQTHALAKIETVCDSYLETLPPPTSGAWKVLYLDYEPDEMSILYSACDGAIACYAKSVMFPENGGSDTSTQSTVNSIVVDCYGIGDPIKTTNPDESFSFGSSVREAQKRAQILSTIVYRAIMDRQENQGSKDVPKWYNSGLTILSRYPASLIKGSPKGNLETKRGICVYRWEFKFNFTEDVPTEPLGLDFAGASSISSETTNPA